jgi:hypothetical protein
VSSSSPRALSGHPRAVAGTARRWREDGAEDSQPNPFGQIN